MLFTTETHNLTLTLHAHRLLIMNIKSLNVCKHVAVEHWTWNKIWKLCKKKSKKYQQKLGTKYGNCVKKSKK